MGGVEGRGPPIESVRARSYTVPTDRGEADGTLAWESTTLVLVEVTAGGRTGLGFTYNAAVTAGLVLDKLKGVVVGRDAFDVPATWHELRRQLRNVGARGIGSAALSAVDLALWDLKARLVGLPLCKLLGQAREQVTVYGSGGFTTYTLGELQAQLSGWAGQGIARVKMKIGTRPAEDPRRVAAAREAIGPEVQLFVDANGAFAVDEAVTMARTLEPSVVAWFEEPVTSDDLPGLRAVREKAPPGMAIAAGEYGYDPSYFRGMLEARCVDVLQADVTRCGGVTGFLEVAALCEAFKVPLSGHTAPSMHLHACLAAPALRHLEYFHDHARIEHMLFDGAPDPTGGSLRPDLGRPGHGLDFKHQDAERFSA